MAWTHLEQYVSMVGSDLVFKLKGDPVVVLFKKNFGHSEISVAKELGVGPMPAWVDRLAGASM